MKKEMFALPITGTLVKLSDVPEKVFADGTLGQGFAVKFTGRYLFSPISGTVIASFPTGHAFIVRRDDGLEVMMHVGIGSAKCPEAFSARVEKYETVTKGQVLTEVKEGFFDDSTAYCPVVFSLPDIEVVLLKEGDKLEALDDSAVRVIY